jgi:hypothetical protein
MDSRGVHIQDLGIDGGGGGFDGDVGTGLDENGAFGLDRDEDSEEEEDDAAEEAAGVGANLVNEFGINKEQLCNELRHTPVDANSVRRTPITKHNIQQQGVLQQQAFCPVRQQNNLPPALNQCLMVPQVPQQQQQPIAPYQALFAAAGVARPPFVASRSAGKLSAEDYYQQMLLSRMEMQEMEEQEQERRRIEREECLAELELQRLERERRLEDKKRERDWERDEEKKE